METKFLLFDAHSIIFRSYYAFIKNPLRNSRGENTSGIFGFLNTIEKVKKRLTTDRICLAFDAPGETFRDYLFKEYKATRPPPPKDIPFQIEKVKEIVQYLGIPFYEIEGYEADDLLATLAVNLKKFGVVYIVSSDKDMLQLIDKNIYVYDAYQDIIYDSSKVKEKFGVPPERISDYLALVGDTIDNIPGIPGIGPQRAKEILVKYPDLTAALAKEIKLKENEELLMLSKRLTALACNLPLKVNPQNLIAREPDLERLIPILIDLELHSFIRELGKRFKSEIAIIEKLDNKIELGKEIGIGISGQDFYIGEKGCVYRTNYERIKRSLLDPNVVKIGYNFKEILKQFPINPPIFDLQIATWLIEPNTKSYGFEDIVLKYRQKFTGTDSAAIARFSCELYPVLKKRLEELNETKVYEDIEEPLIYVLAGMEKRGIKIDVPYLKSLSLKIEKEIMAVSEEIYKVAGRRFNINSPQQLSEVLFEELKLTPIKRGRTHYSTDVEVLQQLSQKHTLPKLILKHRELSKVTSTYIEPLLELAREGRIHTTFNQTGTATGRLSSSNPNIQNIPIKTELGRSLRQGFIPEQGFSFISADYSQIELRILAHITKEKNLLRAFREDKDIHNHTASLVFNVPEDMITDQQRRIAKVVNYGLIYGMSEYGLAQGLDIPREEAMQFIQTYYSLYPDVDLWRKEAIRTAEERGYTETLFGRRRPLPEIYSDNHTIKESARRAAINTPIQGTAADIIKMAMIEIEKRLAAADFKRGLLLSIHDELLFEIEDERIAEAKALIKDVMENVVLLDVPIVVKVGMGKTWAEAH